MADESMNLGVNFTAKIAELTSALQGVKEQLKTMAADMEALSSKGVKANETLSKSMLGVKKASEESSKALSNADKNAQLAFTNQTEANKKLEGSFVASTKSAALYRDNLANVEGTLIGVTKTGLAAAQQSKMSVDVYDLLVKRLGAIGEGHGKASAAMLIAGLRAKDSTVSFNLQADALGKVEKWLVKSKESWAGMRAEFGAKIAPSFDEFIKGISRTQLATDLLTGSMSKHKGVMFDVNKDIVDFTRDLVSLKKELGPEIWDKLTSTMIKHGKTLVDVRKEGLALLAQQNLENSGRVAAEKAITQQMHAMNQLGQAGTAWAKTVNIQAVATDFLNGKFSAANGQILMMGKNADYTAKEMDKINAAGSTLGKDVLNRINSQVGTTINSFGVWKKALDNATAATNRNKVSTDAYKSNLAALDKVAGASAEAIARVKKAVENHTLTSEQGLKILKNYGAASLTLSGQIKTLTDDYGTLLRGTNLMKEGYSQQAQIIKLLSQESNHLMSTLDGTKEKYREVQRALQVNQSWYKKEIAALETISKAFKKTGGEQGKYAADFKQLSAEMSSWVATLPSKVVGETDKLVKKFDQAGREIKKVTTFWEGLTTRLKEGSGTFLKATNYFASLGDSIAKMAAWVPAAMIVSILTQAIAGAVQAVIQFDQSLKSLKAISQGTNAEISLLGKEIIKISNTTKFSASEIAAGAIFVAQAGFTAAESLTVIGAAAIGAQATLESLSTSSDLLTTVIRVFRLEAKDAYGIMDMLAVAANKSKTNLDGLRVVFNYLGPVAESLNMTLSDTLGVIMTLSNVGIRMSTIGTSLRQMFSSLEKPNRALQAALADSTLGMDALDISSKGLHTVLENLHKIIGGDLTKAFQFFQVRAASTAFVLSEMPEHVKLMSKYTQEYGAAMIMAGIQTEGLSVKLNMLSNNFVNMFIKFSQGGLTDALSLALSGVLKLIKGFDWFINSTIGSLLTSLATLTLAFSVLGRALAALSGWLHITALFKSLVASVKLYTTANIYATVSTWSLSAALTFLKGVLHAVQLAAKANWVILVLAGIAAVTIAVYKWIKAEEKNLELIQEEAIKYSVLADKANDYAKKLDAIREGTTNAGKGASDYNFVLSEIARNLPSAAKEIIGLSAIYKDQKVLLGKQAEALREVAKAQADLASDKAVEAYEKLTVKMYIWRVALATAKGDEEKTIALRAKLIKGSEEVAAGIMLMTDAKKKYTLERLPTDEWGVLIKSLVEFADRFEKTLKEVDEIAAKQTTSTFTALGKGWQDFYRTLDAADRAALAKKAALVLKAAQAAQAAAEKNNKDAKAEQQDADAAYLAVIEAGLAKEKEAHIKHQREVLGLIQKIGDDRQKLLKANLEVELQHLDIKKNAEILAIGELDKTSSKYIKDKTALEEKYYKDSFAAITKETQDRLSSQKTIYNAELALINLKNQEMTETKKGLLAEAERTNAEKIAEIWKESLAKHKAKFDEMNKQAEGYHNAYLANIKNIADAEDRLAAKKQTLEEMKRDALRLTMTEQEKEADRIAEFQETMAKGYATLAEAEQMSDSTAKTKKLEQAQKYFDRAEGMVSSLVVKTKQGDKELVQDDAATQAARVTAIANLEKANTQVTTAVIKNEQEAAARNKESFEITKQSIREVVAEYELMKKHFGEAFKVSVNTEEAKAKIQELVGKGASFVIKFEGELSPPAPLAATIEKAKKLLSSIEKYTVEFIVAFKGSVDGVIQGLDASISAVLYKVQALKAAIAREVAVFKVEFVGEGSATKAISDKVVEVRGLMVGLTEELAKVEAKYKAKFVGEDGDALKGITETINSVATGFEELTKSINSADPEYKVKVTTTGSASGGGGTSTPTTGTSTPTTGGITQEQQAALNFFNAPLGGYSIWKPVSQGGGLIEPYAEGGAVPGEGEGDSVPAMLTPGEFVVQKSVVGMLGEGFFHFVNSLKSFSVPKFNMGGLVQSFAQGGGVRKVSDFGDTMTLNLQFGSAKLPLRVVGNPQTTRQAIRSFEKELSRMRLANA